MNTEVQERYKNVRLQLRNLLSAYYKIADEISKKYDDSNEEQFELMNEEQEEQRAKMGVGQLEIELNQLEEQLLEQFKEYCFTNREATSALHTLGFPREDLEELFNEGIKVLKIRKKIIEFALSIK